MSHDVHEIYAVQYGYHARRASENHVFGDPHDAPEPLAYFVWLIRGPHGAIVVDTGFDQRMATRRGRTLLHPVGEGLAALGVRADQVETVVVTHLHYDHTGNHDLFPRARYHLQDAEMAYATGRSMCHAHARVPFEADDTVAMVRKVYDGRVVFHDGDDEIAPGVTVHRIGGHSKGLQAVRVRTRRGHVVLASDASHLYSHFMTGRVFPIADSISDVLNGYETLRRLADSEAHIVPGHDPQVVLRYPAAAPDLDGWVVRLDIEPTATDSD
ncbi:MAG: N-acyl homoserine lactonase family protein [Vicinamibacterales bacterium]